jgi:hypothetical protein
VADSNTSSDQLVYDDYQTPTTHRVVATVEYATRDSLHGDTWEGESDISVPTRDWTSCDGSAQDEQVLAVGNNRNCYLCFSPDHFIVNCPNLTAEQRASILRKRVAQSQNGGLAYGPKIFDLPMGNIQRPYVAKPMGQSSGYHERAYGQNYGYSNPQGILRAATPNRVYSDARPPFRRAVWEIPQGRGGDRVVDPKGTSAQQVAMVETPRGNDTMEHAPLAENSRRDA